MNCRRTDCPGPAAGGPLASRLMVLDRETGEVQHRILRISRIFTARDCLVINDTKGHTGPALRSEEGHRAKIEILLLKRRENDIWRPGCALERRQTGNCH